MNPSTSFPTLLLVALVTACGGRSDPAGIEIDARWSLGPALPAGLMSVAAAAHDGTIYVAGGESESGPSLALYRHTPGQAGWDRLADLPDNRVSAKLLVLDGLLYLVGGSHIRPGNQYHPARAIWVYSPGQDRWAAFTDVPDLRAGTAVGIPGSIVVVGGGFGSAEHGGTFPGDSVALYDLASNSWRYGAPIGTARSEPLAVAVGSHVHVFGGWRADGLGTAHEIEIYDAVSNTWSARGSLYADYNLVVRQAYARAGDHVHFLGGLVVQPGAPALGAHMRYGIAADRWEQLPSMPTPRSNATAVVLPGRIYVIGGLLGPRTLPGVITDVVEVFELSE